jgi:hypothetical protein
MHLKTQILIQELLDTWPPKVAVKREGGQFGLPKEFYTSLGYIARLCLKKQTKRKDTCWKDRQEQKNPTHLYLLHPASSVEIGR